MLKNKYSAIIRTLTGGEKYLKLLHSINSQTIKAEHVYIIQPHGYEPPKETLGIEEFIHCDKGMWMQRIYGMEYCYAQANHSEYLLVLDDDMEFAPDFVEQLIRMSIDTNADAMIPLSDKHFSFAQRCLYLLMGGPIQRKRSPYRNEILRNGSYAYNDSLGGNINPTQSGNFPCFLMRTDLTSKLSLKEELWLDETRYAWPDDQVFFYKAFLMGGKIMSCKTPTYVHNDGKAGTHSVRKRKIDGAYAVGRNSYIFWRKFVYPNFPNKAITQLSFLYRITALRVLYFILGAKKFDLSQFKAFCKGLRDGKNINF